MAVKFIEPGGDATFNAAITTNGGFWTSLSGVTIVTDFVHGNHQKSFKYAINSTGAAGRPAGTVSDTGSRISFYLYINALPTALSNLLRMPDSGAAEVIRLRITSGGILQLWDGTTAQIGTNGSALSTGKWYRISLAYTITSTSINRFELFKDGVSDISITNATLTRTGSSALLWGPGVGGDTTFDMRSSDHYVDDSSSLIDPGNIWVTAKRPNVNGTTNGFTTQIGAGGSGYGTGHSPQVNERALSTTNGWSIVAVGATTEEYNIESKSVGDINISTASIVDYMGWVYTKALLAETGQIILNNVTSNISITSSNTMFTAIAGSSTYPAGTGTDIGMITDATATTVSLFECGIIVAYIPQTTNNFFPFFQT